MKSYLKFLSRNKLYTAIEFIGLAVSLAFVIIIGSYVWQQFAVTREHPDREKESMCPEHRDSRRLHTVSRMPSVIFRK